jgi:hypothetical protein
MNKEKGIILSTHSMFEKLRPVEGLARRFMAIEPEDGLKHWPPFWGLRLEHQVEIRGYLPRYMEMAAGLGVGLLLDFNIHCTHEEVASTIERSHGYTQMAERCGVKIMVTVNAGTQALVDIIVALKSNNTRVLARLSPIHHRADPHGKELHGVDHHSPATYKELVPKIDVASKNARSALKAGADGFLTSSDYTLLIAHLASETFEGPPRLMAAMRVKTEEWIKLHPHSRCMPVSGAVDAGARLIITSSPLRHGERMHMQLRQRSPDDLFNDVCREFAVTMACIERMGQTTKPQQ